jgi:hypothetical protein
MIFRKMARRLSGESGRELSGPIIFILLGLIIVAASGLRLYHLVFDEKDAPLFIQQPGLVQVATYEQAQPYLDQDYPLPTETFESTISVIGVYTEAADYYDQDTMVVAYVKEGWRFMQILYTPQTTIEQELTNHYGYDTQEVNINGITAYLVDVASDTYQCIEPKTEGVPGICTLTRSLLLPYENMVITISADGPNTSNGELISIAKSIN